MPPKRNADRPLKKLWEADPKVFGTERMPLRSSNLKWFVECPMRYLLTMDDEFVANGPMQTGSAVHYLIERMEQTKSKPSAKDWKHVGDKWPAADRETVETYFNGYVRQQPAFETKYGKVIGVEKQGVCKIPAAAFDPTGEAIVITCTIDQLRAFEARPPFRSLSVIDFKVSQQPIADMIKTYALQIATYQLAVSQEYGTKDVASYIMNPLLMAKPRSMFVKPAKFSGERCLGILRAVQTHVAAIRSGSVVRVAGYACGRCPARSPEYC